MMFLLENNIALEIYARRTLRIENLEIWPLLETNFVHCRLGNGDA